MEEVWAFFFVSSIPSAKRLVGSSDSSTFGAVVERRGWGGGGVMPI